MWIEVLCEKKKIHEGETEGASPGEGLRTACEASLGREKPVMLFSIVRSKTKLPAPFGKLVNGPVLTKPYSRLSCQLEYNDFFHSEAGNPLSVTQMINYTTQSTSFPKMLIRMWLS